MLEKHLKTQLQRLGFSGPNFLWDTNRKERIHYMIKEYGLDVAFLVQYVWQGGVRDLKEFSEGYEKQSDYRKEMGWLSVGADPKAYKEEVRSLMVKVALSDDFPYIYCPFKKTRILNFADDEFHIIMADKRAIKDIFCYVSQGVRIEDFSMTDKHFLEREDYLKKVGILD